MTALIHIDFGYKDGLLRAFDDLFSSVLPPNLVSSEGMGLAFELQVALTTDKMGAPDWQVETYKSADDARRACLAALSAQGQVWYISARRSSSISVNASSLDERPQLKLDLCRDPEWRGEGNRIPAVDRDFDFVSDVIQRVRRFGVTGMGWQWFD